MRPPDFWYDPEHFRDVPVLQTTLRAVSGVYRAVSEMQRAQAKPQHVLPAVCVGNVTLGGAGKTPIVRAVRRRLSARGLETHVLSRGYGGKLKGPLRVDPAVHMHSDVGDEPLLHARDGAAWIGRDRVALATAAQAAGAQAVVLDDGLQNWGLAYDVSLLVIDAQKGCGNGRLFPAGPLREPLAAGLKRASAVIVTVPTAAHAELHPTIAGVLKSAGLPVIRSWLEPAGALPDKPLFAFAGIGRPDKFFETLERMGATLVARMGFPDHYAYAERDMVNLAADAAHAGARLITTEKDFVRIDRRWRTQVSVLPVEARFSDDAALDAALAKAAR